MVVIENEGGENERGDPKETRLVMITTSVLVVVAISRAARPLIGSAFI